MSAAGLPESRVEQGRWPAPLAEWGWGGVRFRLLPAEHPTSDLEPVIAVVGLLAILGMWTLPLDLLAGFAGVCRFHAWTGWPCPTCGITRGLLAVAHGDPFRALRMNPLLIGGILATGAYAPVALALWIFRAPRPRIALLTPSARWGTLFLAVAAVLANWAFLVIDGR
ncbi:MAG: DUF2752 domain-containing protein [Acidobacteria bacterium]|nr:MAG: DUF2752 domain-containing protein [Acidobacteriota bacterium]